MKPNAAAHLALLMSALVASAPLQAQSFGASVAVGDGTVFAGEPAHPLRGGLVYFFGRDADGSWSLRGSLEAPDATPGDRFGEAIAAYDDRLLVAAPRAEGGGAVYAFSRVGDEWRSGGRVETDGGAVEAEALAIDGEWAIVGTPAANGERGAAHAFRWDGSAWSRHALIAPAGLVDGDEFGGAVAVSGGRAYVSAPGKGGGAGAIYAFQHDAASDTWQEAGQVGAQVQQQQAGLGTALAVFDDLVLASGPRLLGVGAVVGFEPTANGREYELSSILLPFDGTGGGFGSSLAVAGGELWVGNVETATGGGHAYRFRRDDAGEWVSSEKSAAAGLSRGDRFGALVASAGDVVVVTAPGEEYRAGAAYVFQSDAGAWTEAGRLVGEVAGPSAVTGEEVSCSEQGEAFLFDCSSVDLVSFLPLGEIGAGRGVRINDIWGWTDGDTGRDVVIAGMTDQTVFVDVTDPLRPVYLGRLPMTEGANGSSWRDMKVYLDHAFIVSDGAGEHGMQVFDLRRLRDLDGSSPPTFEADAIYRGVNSAHNVVINEETGYAYIVGAAGGGETCGGGLHMVDIHDPTNPTFAGCFADASTGRSSTGYTHDGQCVVYRGPDERYQGREICFGANETALSIADVTDKSSPVAVAMATYPNVGYSHQGWLSEDQRYFFMDDELDETGGLVSTTRTLVWDVEELEDPILVKEYFSENPSSDHNLYVVGSTMYQSNYVSGLRVLDVSDPVNPVQVGYFDTVPYGEDAPGFSGSWSNYPFFDSGVVAVTSGREGLFLLRYRPRNVS